MHIVLSNIEGGVMQTAYLAASFAVLSIILSPAPYAFAQDAHVARGVVTNIGGNSLTVNVGSHAMQFAIDARTSIEAPGAGTKQRAAEAAGKPGPALADVVKVGQSVAVTYYDINGALHAAKVRAVSKATTASSEEHGTLVAIGWVKEIGDRSITISGDGGGGSSFTQTFTVDERTRVQAKGASTMTKASGGRAPFKKLITSGDRVSVSYEKVGGLLHASDVLVTRKALQ
jgi:uncharacterized protein DUF5666